MLYFRYIDLIFFDVVVSDGMGRSCLYPGDHLPRTIDEKTKFVDFFPDEYERAELGIVSEGEMNDNGKGKSKLESPDNKTTDGGQVSIIWPGIVNSITFSITIFIHKLELLVY